jgi:hypothetical protein
MPIPLNIARQSAQPGVCPHRAPEQSAKFRIDQKTWKIGAGGLAEALYRPRQRRTEFKAAGKLVSTHRLAQVIALAFIAALTH